MASDGELSRKPRPNNVSRTPALSRLSLEAFAEDFAYRAQGNWDLAKKGTNWAYVNAHSYAMDAVAIYV
jgi:hypothetical protein